MNVARLHGSMMDFNVDVAPRFPGSFRVRRGILRLSPVPLFEQVVRNCRVIGAQMYRVGIKILLPSARVDVLWCWGAVASRWTPEKPRTSTAFRQHQQTTTTTKLAHVGTHLPSLMTPPSIHNTQHAFFSCVPSNY